MSKDVGKSRESRKQLSELARIRRRNKVKVLVLFSGMTEKEAAKQLGVSEKTIERDKKLIFEKIKNRIKDKDTVLQDMLLSYLEARESAYQKFKTTGDNRWHRSFLDANTKLAEMLTKWGIIDAATSKLHIEGDVRTTFLEAMREGLKDENGTEETDTEERK